MTKRHAQSKPTWTDVKAKLASLDRTELTSLIRDLYAAHKDNRTFLYTRFGLGDGVLKPYKEMLDRWLWLLYCETKILLWQMPRRLFPATAGLLAIQGGLRN